MIPLSSLEWRELPLQFRGLQDRHPALWPLLPRLLCGLLLLIGVLSLGATFVWAPQWEALAAEAEQESRLRSAFALKAAQVRTLDRLRQEQQAVQAQIQQLAKQLPDKSEMEALLSEINQAGVNRGLQFELFKPGAIQLFDHYAEAPIEVRLTGSFHALAGFVSDIANLQRIVVLDRLVVTQGRDKAQVLECLVRTFRFLDKEESSRQQRAALEARTKGKL